jgi:hypothetical protein
MPEKVVIKIRKAKHADYTVGFADMGCGCFHGYAGGRRWRRRRHHAHGGGSEEQMRSALDSLEQMYKDLFGGE